MDPVSEYVELWESVERIADSIARGLNATKQHGAATIIGHCNVVIEDAGLDLNGTPFFNYHVTEIRNGLGPKKWTICAADVETLKTKEDFWALCQHVRGELEHLFQAEKKAREEAQKYTLQTMQVMPNTTTDTIHWYPTTTNTVSTTMTASPVQYARYS